MLYQVLYRSINVHDNQLANDGMVYPAPVGLFSRNE